MPDPKPPSTIRPISVPIFAITWHTSPSLLPKHIYACSGGGGSAKTGVNNFIEVVIQSPTSGEKTIKIDTGDDVAVALDAYSFVSDEETKEVWILLAVGVQDLVKVYRILVPNDEMGVTDDNGTNNNNDDVKMVGSLDFGKDFMTNTVTFDALGGRIAVGGENGSVCVCRANWDEGDTDLLTIEKEREFNGQHIKGICKVTFHPKNPNILLSSAKDATCRVWDLSKPPENQCLDTLQCKIYDPKDVQKNKKLPKKILNPAPGQCLVKGCVFADIQGQYIFTIQSGRRGKSFLSVWRIVRVPVRPERDGPNGPGEGNRTSQQPPQQSQQQQQPPSYRLAFQEQTRICVADFPISAVSLSGDFKTLALGDTNGSVILLDAETFKRIKYWECIHDLPITSLAARPLPLPLAGEDKTGVAIDAICSSADSKMCFLTRQKRSTLKRTRKQGQGGGGNLGFFFTLLLILFWMFLVAKVSYDICKEDFVDVGSFGDFQNVIDECVVQTIWWAPQDRPGISSVPI